MTKRKYSSFLMLFLLVVAFIFLSGCNRGYGCPSELNIFEFLSKLF